MNRPPSRSGSKKPNRKINRLSVIGNSGENKTKRLRRSSNRKVIRNASKRLSIHEKNVRSAVARIRPRANFQTRVFTGIVIALGLLATLVVFAVFSPFLAVKKIEVVGASRVSSSAIIKDLTSLKGKPLPQITSEELAQKLSKYQLIDSVSAVSLPPSTLKVVVVERSAIAVVNINGIAYLYDVAGVQLGRASENDVLPVIQNAGNPASSSTFKQAVDVLLSIPMELLPKVESVSAKSKDDVLLRLRSYGQKVLWGDNSQSSLKATVLDALMKNYLKKPGQTFDVSAPNQPSIY